MLNVAADGGRVADVAALGAIDALQQRLGASVANLHSGTGIAGDAQALAGAVHDIVEATRGHRLGMPSRQVAAIVARRFLSGATLSDVERDKLAWALCEPLDGAAVESVCASGRRFGELLTTFRQDARHGTLPRMTWFGLFASSMAFDPSRAAGDARAGWKALRATLRETWPGLGAAAGWVPDWMQALRDLPQMLLDDACGEFAVDCLRGDRSRLDRIAGELGVPPHSWFWSGLQRTVARCVVRMPDDEFRACIDPVVSMLRDQPGEARDDVLAMLFERLSRARDRSPVTSLRDYAFSREVWKSPRQRDAGGAPAWHALSDVAWALVMGWLSDTHWKAFFEDLLAVNGADEGRREFWARYARQVSGCRLACGAATLERARRDPVLSRALSASAADLAVLTGRWKAVDALIIEIGAYVFVETSVKGSTCYAYPRDNLPFEPAARSFGGGVADLGAGYYHRGESRDLRFPREAGWQAPMAHALARLGIEPDRG